MTSFDVRDEEVSERERLGEDRKERQLGSRYLCYRRIGSGVALASASAQTYTHTRSARSISSP